MFNFDIQGVNFKFTFYYIYLKVRGANLKFSISEPYEKINCWRKFDVSVSDQWCKKRVISASVCPCHLNPFILETFFTFYEIFANYFYSTEDLVSRIVFENSAY